jgi:ATP synthase protein I
MVELLNKAVRSALFFMSAFVVAWAVVPEGRTVAAGLALGTLASVMNALLLRRRVEMLGKAVTEQGPTKQGLGLASRLATVLLAAMIATRYPEYFALPATLASCFFVQIAVFFAAIAQNKNRSDGEG